MWPDPQENVDLISFNESIVEENLIFCRVIVVGGFDLRKELHIKVILLTFYNLSLPDVLLN